MKMTPFLLVTASAIAIAGAHAQDSTMNAPPMSTAQKAKLLQNALSAAPSTIAAHATVLAPGAGGKMTVLRDGTNGFTCIAGDKASLGHDPMCADAAGMKWAQSWMAHDAKPANEAPGIIYMLAGSHDVSATDPWATTTTHWVTSPPHWMIMWPFEAQSSGLPSTPKSTGTWIMWAGTPYAHLMVNQTP